MYLIQVKSTGVLCGYADKAQGEAQFPPATHNFIPWDPSIDPLRVSIQPHVYDPSWEGEVTPWVEERTPGQIRESAYRIESDSLALAYLGQQQDNDPDKSAAALLAWQNKRAEIRALWP